MVLASYSGCKGPRTEQLWKQADQGVQPGGQSPRTEGNHSVCHDFQGETEQASTGRII